MREGCFCGGRELLLGPRPSASRWKKEDSDSKNWQKATGRKGGKQRKTAQTRWVDVMRGGVLEDRPYYPRATAQMHATKILRENKKKG